MGYLVQVIPRLVPICYGRRLTEDMRLVSRAYTIQRSNHHGMTELLHQDLLFDGTLIKLSTPPVELRRGPNFDCALHPGIVEASDAIKYVQPCLDQGQLAAAKDGFTFDHTEETLRHRVVGAVADLAHAAEDVVIGKKIPVLTAG